MWINDDDVEKIFEDLKTTNGEVLDIKAEFTSLDLDSMSKFQDEQTLQVCDVITSGEYGPRRYQDIFY